jgi:uncharacterized damage-inducible protein DinB
MNSKESQQLLDYHYWARDRVLEAAKQLSPDDFTRDLGSSFKSVRDTLVHVYSAEWVWCSRWEGESPSAMIASNAFDDVPALREAWGELEVTMRSVVERFGRAGFDQVIEYRDLKGTLWRQPFWEMLHHVVNHASYHRGQVTAMLRQLHAQPPESMDLITYYRAHSAAT